MLQVERRKVHHVFDALLGHVLHNPVGGAAVRVDKGDSLAVADVLDGHVFQQGRFAHAGLADDVHVPRAVLALDAKRQFLAPRVRLGKIGYLIRVFSHILILPHSVSVKITLLKRLFNWSPVQPCWRPEMTLMIWGSFCLLILDKNGTGDEFGDLSEVSTSSPHPAQNSDIRCPSFGLYL